MADIELLIKIDEETYKDIKSGKVYSSMRDVPQESVLAIANGKPLPKGHGRLKDEDEIVKAIEDRVEFLRKNDAVFMRLLVIDMYMMLLEE